MPPLPLQLPVGGVFATATVTVSVSVISSWRSSLSTDRMGTNSHEDDLSIHTPLHHDEAAFTRTRTSTGSRVGACLANAYVVRIGASSSQHFH